MAKKRVGIYNVTHAPCHLTIGDVLEFSRIDSELGRLTPCQRRSLLTFHKRPTKTQHSACLMVLTSAIVAATVVTGRARRDLRPECVVPTRRFTVLRHVNSCWQRSGSRHYPFRSSARVYCFAIPPFYASWVLKAYSDGRCQGRLAS